MTQDNPHKTRVQAARRKAHGTARAREAAMRLYAPTPEEYGRYLAACGECGEPILPGQASYDSGKGRVHDERDCPAFNSDLSHDPPHGSDAPPERPKPAKHQGVPAASGIHSAKDKVMPKDNELKDSSVRPADPRGMRIDGYFGPGLLRPGVGKLVQRTSEPQYCGSMAFRVFSVDESPHKLSPGKISRRFSGEFMGVTFEGKQIWAADGYLPSSIERTALSAVQRGDGFGFAGDLWCEPAEKTPLGYAFAVYDRRPRGEADPLMALAIAAGVVAAPALPAPAAAPMREAGIDPETGEILEAARNAA